MRRFLATVVGVVLLVIATAYPRTADADVRTIGSVGANEVTGGYVLVVPTLTVSQVTQVTARIRREGETTVFAGVEDFASDSSTGSFTRWTSAHPVPLPTGRYSVDVTARGSEGVIEERANALLIINRIRTRFVDAGISPAQVDIEHDTVTMTGRLLYAAADGSEHGLADAALYAQSSPYPTGVLGEGRTDAEGRFSLTFSGGGANAFYVGFPGDETHRSSTTGALRVTYRSLPTRLGLTVTQQQPIVGETVTLRGLLEHQGSGAAWTPLSGRTVHVFFWDAETQTQSGEYGALQTGADGSYAGTFRMPGSGSWIVHYNHGTPLDFGYDGAVASSPTTYLWYRTAITGLDAGPEPVGKGAKVTARGHLGRVGTYGDRTVVKGGLVELQFSPDGRTWSDPGNLPNARTNQNGDFVITATAVRDGYWRATYHGDSANGSNVIPDMYGASAADYVDVRYRTAISSFNASPEPVGKGRTLTVSGKLSRYVSSWGAFGGQKIYVYFQPKGSTTFGYAGVTTTTKTGTFRKGFTAAKDGTWRVAFKAISQYVGVTSGGDYVDVR